eukprot:TRINITY_DN1146_c0_g1_i1.p1 TRINITY_DN1146_c0_g1~~TRINITY_DN1146_c0_g1_i1.p1  ORF type:complete len:220 (-),score=51.10 TRINITY_DN1146_c0_g1_i1:769-1428(-)
MATRTDAEVGSLLDSLPYHDTQYNEPDIKAKVDRLVSKEMAKFTPKDYLEQYPLPQVDFKSTALLGNEWKRLHTGEAMAPLDTSRYHVPKPEGAKAKKSGEWVKSVENAQAQLQHQYLRLVNLELFQKYGANAWRQRLKESEATKNSLTQIRDTYQAEIDTVNRKRKADQLEVGEQLSRLEAEWQYLVRKNIEIQRAIQKLELAKSKDGKSDAEPTAGK